MLAKVTQGSSANAVTLARGSDQSVTSSTALVDETTLQQGIGAGETWVFTWTLSATFSATGQVKVAVVVPAGATLLAVAQLVPNAIVPAFGVATASGTGISLVALGSTAGAIIVTATVINGATPGTVKLQFAQNTVDGTATTIKAASNVVARRA